MHTLIHSHHSTPFLSDYKFYTHFIHPITQNEKHSHHSPNEQHSFLKTQPLRTSYSLFTFLSSNTFYYPFPTILLNLSFSFLFYFFFFFFFFFFYRGRRSQTIQSRAFLFFYSRSLGLFFLMTIFCSSISTLSLPKPKI